MIELKNINMSFNQNPVLKNLNAKINVGDFIVIVGPNGTGKSTLLNLIAGKIKPFSGNILLKNKNITDLNELQRAPFIARLFQDPKMNTVDNLSVSENLQLAMLKNTNASLKKIPLKLPLNILEALKFVNGDSEKLLNKKMGALSGGQRQMIALLMASIFPPQLLLLDEPTAALDPHSTKKMITFTSQFIKNHNITTLLITHEPRFALTLGNKLWIMGDGEIKKEFGQEKNDLSVNELIEEISKNTN